MVIKKHYKFKLGDLESEYCWLPKYVYLTFQPLLQLLEQNQAN